MQIVKCNRKINFPEIFFFQEFILKGQVIKIEVEKIV